TEALAGRGLHHHPALHTGEPASAKLLQAGDLRLDVVGFDVEMKAALMLYLLHLDVQVAGIRFQVHIDRLRRILLHLRRHPERLAPEIGRAFQIVGAAVDDETGKAAVMHGSHPFRQEERGAGSMPQANAKENAPSWAAAAGPA